MVATMTAIARNAGNNAAAGNKHNGRGLIRHLRKGMSDPLARFASTSNIACPPKVKEEPGFPWISKQQLI
jgi:hypothetical protein